MSLIGREINDFSVKAFVDGDFKDITKQDLLGKWSVIVFYPADFTFVCPTELSDLADLYEEFQKIGTEIYSVSTDTHYVHKAWHDASDTIKKVKFPMLADPTGKLSRDFGVYIEDEGVALRAALSLIQRARLSPTRSTTTVSAVMLPNSSARFRLLSLWPSTAIKSAQQDGVQVPTPSLPALSWSVSYKVSLSKRYCSRWGMVPFSFPGSGCLAIAVIPRYDEGRERRDEMRKKRRSLPVCCLRQVIQSCEHLS